MSDDFDLPIVVVGEKTIVARWADRRCKTWIELTEESVNGRSSYGYVTSWGARGTFGTVMLRHAFARIESDRNLCPTHLKPVSLDDALEEAA